MKKSTFLLLLTIICTTIACNKKKETNIISTETLFQAMKEKYDGKRFKDYTFKQLTMSYDENGEMTDSTLWYEAVSYPQFFRIDRDVENHHYVIYRNDSTYNFSNDTLARVQAKPATHLLFKGGLYFMDLEAALQKLKSYNYNIASFKKDTLKGTPAYVVGNDDLQFWVHAKHFYCMRRLYKTNSGKVVDAYYDDFKQLNGGWVEQKVTFYVDGVERLREFYQDITYRDSLDLKIYSPQHHYKWYEDYY